MIEGGNAGGSAQLQAAERRAHAQRLQAEAARLDVVAADEQATAARLGALPESYVILHDLSLPDGRGRVDHLVVGPGGAFLVVTRRVDAPIGFLHGQLTSGAAPLGGMVDAARAESQPLTAALGTPVVPVIGFVGAPVAADVPPAVGGALVCAADQLATVISRGSHTLLPSTKVREIADKALPMLSVPGARPRQGLPAPSVVRGAPSPLPPPPPTAAAAVAPDAPDAPDARMGRRGLRGPSAGYDRRSGDRRKSGRSEHDARSRRFIITAIVSACLVAFAAGGLLRVLFADEPVSSSPALTGGSGSGAGVTSPSTTIEIPVSSTAPGAVSTTVPKVADVPAPKVSVLPVCQLPGSGWTLVPAWPGPLKGLDKYVVQVLQPDGTWKSITAFRTNDTPKAGLAGQPPNVTLTVRIIAVMKDDSRSPGSPTPIVTPATSC